MMSIYEVLALFGFFMMTVGAFLIHYGLGIVAIGLWCVVLSSQHEGSV